MAVEIVYEHIFYDNGHNSHVATYSLSVTMETGHMQTIAFHGITKYTGSKTKGILFLLIAICLRASQLLTMLKTFAFAAMLLCLLDVSKSATVNAGQATKPHIVFMMVDDWG